MNIAAMRRRVNEHNRSLHLGIRLVPDCVGVTGQLEIPVNSVYAPGAIAFSSCPDS
jgi:hypothetical protein